MTKYLIESKLYKDQGYTQPLPKLIGVFDSREDAEAYIDAILPLWGSYTIAPVEVAGTDTEDGTLDIRGIVNGVLLSVLPYWVEGHIEDLLRKEILDTLSETLDVAQHRRFASAVEEE